MSFGNGLALVDPQSYADHGYPHALMARLRKEAPVHRFEPPGWRPIWALTRQAEIREISRQPERFVNGPRMTLVDLEAEALEAEGSGSFGGMRTIINMDPPDHRAYRKVASPWFTPNRLRRLDGIVKESARYWVDEMAREGRGGEFDFITRVAAMHPLRVIGRILGVPEEDEPFVLRLTNELFGGEDPEFQRSSDRQKRVVELGTEFFQYFNEVLEDRRRNPRDDLVSVLAAARIDGQPMGPMETLGYCLITFTAGHETTRGAIGGGLVALMEHPEELAKLRADLSLIPSAMDEIVRWVTPVNWMARTATEGYELAGQQIAKDDTLVMFYASANRDERVYEDPECFRVDRYPNPHLGFGVGEHFCLGANLARKTSGALFTEIVSRLESIEIDGPVERLASNLVPGLKHLPIRCRIGPARVAT